MGAWTGSPIVEFYGAEKTCQPAWDEKVHFNFSTGGAEASGEEGES